MGFQYTFGKGVAKYTFKKSVAKYTFKKGVAKSIFQYRTNLRFHPIRHAMEIFKQNVYICKGGILVLLCPPDSPHPPFIRLRLVLFFVFFVDFLVFPNTRCSHLKYIVFIYLQDIKIINVCKTVECSYLNLLLKNLLDSRI